MEPEAAAGPTVSEGRSSGQFWFPLAVEAAALVSVAGLALAGVRTMPPPPAAGATGGWFIWYFFSAFATATVLMVLLLRTSRGSRWFAALFSLAVFVGVGVLGFRFFGAGGAILASATAVLSNYSVRRVAVFDLILVCGLAGVTLSLAETIPPLAALAILAILSLYDIFAVFVTGHMVRAAEALLRQRAFFAIIVPLTPRGFLNRLSAVEPGRKFLFLGTGDLVLPVLLVVATARFGGIYGALIVLAGSLAGLAGTHLFFMNQKRLRPIPALPSIALGAILGYLVSFLALG